MSDTIINDKRWRPSSMIVWGNTIRGRGPTVHLPGVVGAYGCSTGATAACDRRESPPILCAWTFNFGGPKGGAVHLCRRCFPGEKPNRKLRPAAGWLRYAWPKPARAADERSGT
jgi:hypothetical protein